MDGISKMGTYASVGLSTRFHILKSYFFLHFWEFPLTGPHPNTYITQFALLKIL